MTQSTYKLNKQSDNIQHWRTPFPIVDQTALAACWETWMQFKKQQIELNMEQQTGSK